MTRVVIVCAVVTGLFVGLGRLEGAGPRPAHSLRQQIVSSDHAVVRAPSDSDPSADNPNRKCKPQGFPGCRPPSGD